MCLIIIVSSVFFDAESVLLFVIKSIVSHNSFLYPACNCRFSIIFFPYLFCNNIGLVFFFILCLIVIAFCVTSDIIIVYSITTRVYTFVEKQQYDQFFILYRVVWFVWYISFSKIIIWTTPVVRYAYINIYLLQQCNRRFRELSSRFLDLVILFRCSVWYFLGDG